MFLAKQYYTKNSKMLATVLFISFIILFFEIVPIKGLSHSIVKHSIVDDHNICCSGDLNYKDHSLSYDSSQQDINDDHVITIPLTIRQIDIIRMGLGGLIEANKNPKSKHKGYLEKLGICQEEVEELEQMCAFPLEHLKQNEYR